jgi:hypothetical protein
MRDGDEQRGPHSNRSHTGAGAKAICLLTRAEASRYHSLSPKHIHSLYKTWCPSKSNAADKRIMWAVYDVTVTKACRTARGLVNSLCYGRVQVPGRGSAWKAK